MPSARSPAVTSTRLCHWPCSSTSGSPSSISSATGLPSSSGAILAALLLLLATSPDDVKLTATANPPKQGTAFVMELVLTAIFVMVILQASRSEAFGSSALVAIPLTLVAIHLAAVPLSGASVNPARTLGPDLVGNTWDGVWLYFLGPLLGAAIGWAVHKYAVAGYTRRAEGAVAEVLEQLEEPRNGDTHRRN